jgi:hypothetical protein
VCVWGGGELLQVLLKYIISHQQEICRCFEKGCSMCRQRVDMTQTAGSNVKGNVSATTTATTSSSCRVPNQPCGA